MSFLREVVDSTSSIVKGHFATIKEFFRPPITVHYPEQKLQLPKGARGVPALVVNDKGELNCNACGLCERNCPPGAIQLEMAVSEDGKKLRRPAYFNLDMSRCMQCNLCVEACAFDALEMSDAYENAAYRLEDLVYDMDELAELWKTHNSVRIAGGEKI